MQVISATKKGTKVLMVVCKGLEVWKESTLHGRLQLWHGVITDNSQLDKGIVTVKWGAISIDELIADLRVSL